MTRGLAVAIYDRNGLLMRWRGGTVQGSVRRLRFSTSVPGGFGVCTFDLALSTARRWPVEPGYRCVVSLGQDVVWWGWVEDITRGQRGQGEWLSVMALGPWQQVNQRLISETYNDVNSTYIVRDMLAEYCPDISQDYSQLVNSGVPLTIDWTYRPLPELIKLACQAGDSVGRPLLFAIWEPPGSKVSVSQAGVLNDDPELEQLETYWQKGSDLLYYVTSQFVSARYSWRWMENASSGITHKRRIPVAASTSYVVDYSLYWTAFSGMTSASRLDWYNVSNTLISSSYGATRTSDGTATGWRSVSDTLTSPAGAVEAVLGIGASVGSGGGAARFLGVDDVRMYLYTATLAPQTKPRAYLWSRDLSTYDYGVRSSALAEGLQVTTTTRDLANWVIAGYGSSSFTGAAQDAASQALYRRRDVALSAGSVALVDAQAQRDTWLTLHAEPGATVGSLRLARGSLLDRRGLLVDPARLRAGDRLRVLDGALAGTVILVESTEYDAEAGVVSVQPESYTDVSRMLARV